MKNLKMDKNIKIIIYLLTTMCFCLNACAEESLLKRLFFDDFKNLGLTVTVDPMKSAVIAFSLAITTDLLMDNDKYFSHEIEASKNNFDDSTFNFFNNFGDGLYILAADSIFFAIGGDKEKKIAEKIVETLAVSGSIAYVTKIIVGRERPSESSSPFVYRPFSFFDSSLPSGHTTAAFAWATIIGDSYNIGYITYPLAFLCGVARIYKNEHWPSDVLLGGFIGAVTGKVINFENPNISISFKNEDSLNFVQLNIKF